MGKSFAESVAQERLVEQSAENQLSAATKYLSDSCRSELCTVVHGHAVCNGRDRKKTTRLNNLGLEYPATNQVVVGHAAPAAQSPDLGGV
jgi:hypothetical protein